MLDSRLEPSALPPPHLREPACGLALITTVPVTLRFFHGQIGYMKARGFRVRAISSPDPVLWDFVTREAIAGDGVRMSRRVSPLSDLRALAGLCAAIRRHQPSVVHSHTPKAGLLGMIAATVMRVPVRVHHIHGLPHVTARGITRRLLCGAERVACRLAHEVLCVSPSIRQVAIDEGVCPANRIRVLCRGSINGVDAEGRFNPERVGLAERRARREALGVPHDAFVVGFVGRLVRDKGILELVHAWQILRDESARLQLLIVGPFEDRDGIPADDADVLRQDPRVHLIGEDLDTPSLYAAMDLVCLPTYREGLPVVPLEAAAMGLPVVATRVPGCVDAVEDGRTGTLVAAGDAVALAHAIRTYLQDDHLRRAHGAAGRARVLRDFRPGAIWEAQYAAYLDLLRRKRLSIPRGELAVAESGDSR